jgi:hypothetical protein
MPSASPLDCRPKLRAGQILVTEAVYEVVHGGLHVEVAAPL